MDFEPRRDLDGILKFQSENLPFQRHDRQMSAGEMERSKSRCWEFERQDLLIARLAL